MVGEVVGVVRDGDYAVGIQAQMTSFRLSPHAFGLN